MVVMFSFRNIAVNLKASGLSAALISWVAGVTLVGIFGKGDVAVLALGILSITAVVLFIVLAVSASESHDKKGENLGE
jgi:hypothetical protein